MIPDCAGTVMNYNWIPISTTPTSLIFQEMQTCKIHHPWLMVISCHLSFLSTFIHYPRIIHHQPTLQSYLLPSGYLTARYGLPFSKWFPVRYVKLPETNGKTMAISSINWKIIATYIYILYQRKKMIKMGDGKHLWHCFTHITVQSFIVCQWRPLSGPEWLKKMWGNDPGLITQCLPMRHGNVQKLSSFEESSMIA